MHHTSPKLPKKAALFDSPLVRGDKVWVAMSLFHVIVQ